MKKVFIFILVAVFLNIQVYPLYAYTQIPVYLCEIGIKFYHQGRYADALLEFNKALMIKPDLPLALEYIEKIRQKTELRPEEIAPPVRITPEALPPLIKKEVPPPIVKPPLLKKEIPPAVPKEIYLPAVLMLDESIKDILQPIELEHAKTIIIGGKNIRRFLATQPDILIVEKKGPDELLVTGNQLGYTYLNIWDERDRWTLEFLVTPPRPEEPTYEELMRLAFERAATFKLRYNLDWSSYETGRRIKTLERGYYSYTHGLNLTGETPYGNLDSTASVRALRETTDLTYFTLGLNQAKYGRFKNFSLRTFDYYPGFSNLAFGGASLRGVMLKSPAFGEKINYTIFWGREGGGRYGGLSPSLAETKNSFLSGFDVDYFLSKRQNYGFSVLHGWGRDREDYLNRYSYDFDANWNLDKVKLGYEVGYDSESFAHLLDLNYTVPKLNLNAQLRDISKKYLNINAWGWRLGELGGLFSLSYMPTEKLGMSSRLDIFQDRLYPATDNDDRWNQYFDWDINYAIDPLTSLRLDYSLQNELGRISKYRSHGQGIGLYRTFELPKKVHTFLNYRHEENKYFTSSTSDYINERLSMGLRFSLIGDLYYYLNKEFNWLEARFYGDSSKPQATETGIDWAGQIFKSPFYGNLRCMYRDEENTVSTLSFLSGEDYLEGYGELSYRPNPDKELYGSVRIRNVWADNPNVNKRVEADFRAGMRYLWDTGVRWESIGAIEGYVFKDYNSDGLRQRDEPPVEGIKIWLGKDKSQVSDTFGYYKFTKVKARKAYLNIDATTVPSGFVLTVPATQEIAVAHGQTVKVNFGIVSRSEIAGFVFEDVDADGQFGPRDSPIKEAVLILEDGTKVSTDDSGRYSFRKASVGKHTLTLDLNSIPPNYIPTVPIFRDIELFEGVIYIYNIPLERIKD